jgi:hypothetical protein
MTVSADRKPKTFFVHHRPTKRQRAEVDRLSVTLRHLPQSLTNIAITCPACKTVFPPDWFKKHEMSMIPVKPKFETKGVPYTGPKRWILQSITQVCPRCGAHTQLPLPTNEMRTRGSLFGDDAEREHEGRKVSIYSLVGADQSLLPDFEMKVRALKQGLLPAMPPDSWKIHMKDIWAGTNRAKHPAYKALSLEDVIGFTNQVLALIKESNLFIYNIALTTDRDKPSGLTGSAGLRNEAYILLVLNAIDEWTEKNAQPNIFFDSEKYSHANEVIHGWARDTFRGSQHSLLYGFLSKGIEIPEPKFVSPASSPGLEIADFVSFTIARLYDRMWKGKEIEIDPGRMGLVTYLGYDSNGNLLWRRQEGYPWEQLYQ